MELPSTFEFRGWKVRYSLLMPSSLAHVRRPTTKSVVFVHGTPWSSAVYRPIIDALRAKELYAILTYDLPGYGQSQVYGISSKEVAEVSSFVGDTTVRFQAEALRALLQHVKMDGREGRLAPAVIAHDIAGSIVLRAHLMLDCEFESMLLCDTNAVLPWGDGFYKLARSEPQTFLQLPPAIFEAVVRAVVRSACHDPQVLQAEWEDTLARPWLSGEGQRNFLRQIAQANDADVAGMLDDDMYERVSCDVKIVWGEQDQWIPREKIEELIRRLKGRAKECAFIPSAGHLVMLDQPTRFELEVFNWLVR